ncbi:hypothetical protein [Brevundimonas sp. Root1423]|uniref:hypothetical protein n=1 Tax=Brevundimonas sp. Root1423 TaxID=1736462 RepID=UPI0006F9C4E8|nr:hypothetical protein [Brevundimonas sp. Root1423]KQY96449.1 hypothetical protein ASD25_00745 [Brevundimonas sp. Root1423]
MSLLAAFMALGLQAATQETRTPVADLLGLTPAEVAARTGAAPDAGPRDAVRIAEAGKVLDLYPVRRFWRQPARADEGCLTGLEIEPAEGDSIERRRSLMRRTGALMVFQDGRLSGVYAEPALPPAPSTGAPVTTRDLEAQMRGPRPPSLLTVAPGRLPLSDGAAVLARLEPAAAGAALVSLCRAVPPRTYRSDPGMDLIWGLVGLTVLPLVPFQQAEEARADREGSALLAAAEPGEDLGASAEDWVGRVRGARVYRDSADPDFAIIAIKLGSGADTAAKVGLLGVRGTRVVWKVEREAADQTGLRALVCRDDANRATNARRGCSGTGFLIP